MNLSSLDIEAMVGGQPARTAPIAEAARAAIDSTLGDGARVRSAKVGREVIVLVVTTKPAHGMSGQTINAGIEPRKTVQEALDLAVFENDQRVAVEFGVGSAVHTGWAFSAGPGRLVRTWRRGSAGNEDEQFFAVTRTGTVKPIDRIAYQRLRRALAVSSPR